MMKLTLYLIKKLLLTTLLLTPMFVSASVVVVANVDKPITLSKSEVKALFMGGSTSYELTAVTLKRTDKTRAFFNARVIGMTESRIQSYWAQMRFSGRQTPPKEFKDADAIMAYLVENPNSVAYLSSDVELESGLTVVYQSAE